ncbi:hypothetical protein GCM10009737_36200 [Nocardioides lentus]|uniref:Calcineurin-like phosphoesterase domain-containing protein n=1 Tax=Nocardioides lentus TaxID=338077 RepID=A0ABP5B7U5_9ACTN
MHQTSLPRALVTAAGLVVLTLAAAVPGATSAAPASTGARTEAATVDDQRAPVTRGPYDEPVHTFVSAPDLFNADVADVRVAESYRSGAPNSWNAHWAATVDNVFGQLAAYGADSYLVAGDLVNGRWHRDRGNTGTFGPGRTTAEKLARIRRAGAVYYGAWRRFWTDAGVPMSRVHAAVGDHEVGDNPWNAGDDQLRAFWTYKKTFARHFTTRGGTGHRYPMHPRGTVFDDTAYATYLAGGRVLLVTVDVFDKRDGAIRTGHVDRAQLAWLDRTLAAAPASTTILVQGHTPALEPVRRRNGGGPSTAYGEGTAFWQTLTRHDVDLYLAGEVHDFTAVQRGGGPVQLTHGGYAGGGRTDYVVGDVLDDGSIEIDARSIDVVSRSTERIWQTGGEITAALRLAPTSRSVGTLVIDPSGRITERSGCLAAWDGRQEDGCTTW